MAVWRYVDFSVKEAQRLADLASVETDLETTENMCELFIKERQKPEPFSNPGSFLIFEALCTAAIVKYGRSFVSGVREIVPDHLIAQLSQEHQESHVFFMGLRHRWVAHSVNTFEVMQVVAYLTPEERGPQGVSSISARPHRISSLGIEEMSSLQKLAAAVRESVKRVIQGEEQKVLSYARSLPPSQFYMQGDPPAIIPGDKDPGKARKKW